MSETIPIYELNADVLASLILTRANAVFSGRLPAIKYVSVTEPTSEQFRMAWQSNGLLAMERGIIEIKPEGDLPPLVLRVPMPFHGVFVLQSHQDEALGKSSKNTLWTWCPWLAEAGGARLIRGNTNRAKLNLRIGSGGESYIDMPVTDESGLILSEESFRRGCESKRKHRDMLIQTPDRLPPVLKAAILHSGAVPVLQSPDASSSEPLWDSVRVCAVNQDGIIPITDLDDLNRRMLMTYTFWLASKIIEGVWKKAFVDVAESSTATQSKRWTTLVVGGQRAIEASLFPKKTLLKTGKLHAFRPANPIDAISQLTQIKRYDVSPGVINHLPAVFHQNHPSFSGCLCPVETPESELLGISLHLAKGVSLDTHGILRPCADTDHGLGWAASLIPFFEHNDAVRNMMGAKNLKQSVAVAARQPPAIATAQEDNVFKVLAPLMEQGIVPDAADASGRLALGVDLLVAYMPYFGLNFEDAIVANRRLVDEGILDLTREENLSFRVKPGYESFSEHRNVLHITDDHMNDEGVAKQGTLLCRGMTLATLWHPRSESEHHIRYQDMEAAELLSIHLDYDRFFGGRLTCRIRRSYPLGSGDKLMGRHGNKGVVSTFLSPEKMPRLPDSESLPSELRGRAVDLVLNPHGVISRMNLGQLMETHLGWLYHALPPSSRQGINFDCKAFSQEYPKHTVQISKAFLKTGLDATGKIPLKLEDGQLTEQPVVVGFQHIVRLRHIPSLKSQSRGRREASLYDARTGQAVHGRRAGGGQRIGEMELWALAGHQADRIISETLYTKADVRSFDHPVSAVGKSTTWKAIQDHLFSVGVSAELHDGKVQFAWARLDSTDWSSGSIAGSKDLVSGFRSAFQCPTCSYCPSDEALFHGISKKYVELNEVLRTLGWTCPDKPEKWDADGENKKGVKTFSGQWKLRSLKSSGTALADVECTEKKTDISIRMRFRAGKGRKETILTARGRKPELGGSSARQTKIGFTADGIACLTSDIHLRPIGELHVTCAAEHPSVELSPIAGRGVKSLQPSADGLFNPTIFGDAKGTLGDECRWGHIELPQPIPYPASVFHIKGLQSNEDAAPPPMLKYVPVLPVKYRALDPDSRDESELPKVNIEYRKLLDLCRDAERLSKKKPDAKRHAELMGKIESAVESVLEFCCGILNGKAPKEGLLRRHGLGRRVDCSGRLVIVPDPELSPAACKVPVHILWELISSDVVKWLKEAEVFFSAPQSGRLTLAKAFAEAESVAVMAASKKGDLYDRRFDILNKKLLDVRTAADLRSRTVTDGSVENLCLRTVEGFLKEHPEKRIILNRQPSLHKYSILAFRPIPTRMADGDVLRISPIVCGPLGADFDGDEMALHWPLSDAAHQEAERLLFRNNLVSEANARSLAHYAQDIVLGLYLLKQRGRESDLFDLLPDHDKRKKCCRATIESCAAWDEDAGTRLLQHICLEHADKAERVLQNLFVCAFRSATVSGTSFGYFDLCPPPRKAITESVRKLDSLSAEEVADTEAMAEVLSEVDKSLSDITMTQLRGIAQSSDFSSPGYGMAVMAVSGARGAGQATQLITMRGLLSAGALGFDASPCEFLFRHNLANGCDRETYYRTVYNARSSMCDKKLGTGKAGWLTRELVGGMWDVIVVPGDCGAEGKRSAATCKLDHGVCQCCYGAAVMAEADYVDSKSGFYCGGYPAGLIAAQSIGERGTQLSMQSFHTAKRAFTPDTVRKLLNNPALFDFASFALMAPAWDKDAGVQFRSLAEAVYDLTPSLRDLHTQIQKATGSTKAQVTKAIKALVADVLRNPALAATVNDVLVSRFVAMFKDIKAYNKLLPRHLELLWRRIHISRDKKLSRLTGDLPPLAALGFCPIRATLYRLASEKMADNLDHPASKIMVGSYSTEG